MKRLQRLFAIVITVLILVFSGSAGVLWYLSRPNPSPVGFPPMGLRAELISFSTSDNLKLVGWLITGRPDRGAVILMHGSQQNRLAMLSRARFLSAMGYTVLLFDLRAHGESEGAQTTEGCRETADAQAAVDFIARRFPDKKRAVIGFSLGGVAAALATPPLAVRAMVLEGVSPGLTEAYSNRLNARFGAPGRWLTPIVTSTARFVLGCSARQLRPVDTVGRIAAAKLFIAGEYDELTTPTDALEVAEAASPPKSMWLVPHARHTDNFHDMAPAAYEKRVLDFLDATLGR